MDLVTDLRSLGLTSTSLLTVHASMRAIGGRAEDVVAALDQFGTTMMTLGAIWDVPFDALSTPAQPDVGILAEVFRTTPGTLVSNHPEGRFGARGPQAAWLVASQPWNDYFGPGSPLERFANANGKVLRLGADANTTTLLHYAEQLVDLPNLRRIDRPSTLVTPGGLRPVVCTTRDDEDGIVDWPGEDYFATIIADYRSALPDRVTTGTFGNTQAELFDGADLVHYARDWMTERFRALTSEGAPDGSVTVAAPAG